LWHVGVKAPGTANSTTRLPENSSPVVFGTEPASVMTVNLASGSLSPTAMTIPSPFLQKA
jgi:hypothetical protein